MASEIAGSGRVAEVHESTLAWTGAAVVAVGPCGPGPVLCCMELQLWCTDDATVGVHYDPMELPVPEDRIVMELPVPEEDRDPVGS